MTQPKPANRPAIRHRYEQLGAPAFHEQHGAAYRNPHEAAIGAGVRAVVPQIWNG